MDFRKKRKQSGKQIPDLDSDLTVIWSWSWSFTIESGWLIKLLKLALNLSYPSISTGAREKTLKIGFQKKKESGAAMKENCYGIDDLVRRNRCTMDYPHPQMNLSLERDLVVSVDLDLQTYIWFRHLHGVHVFLCIAGELSSHKWNCRCDLSDLIWF